MATLEKIRNKAGLLVSIVLGAALLAFILGDFLKKGNSGRSDNSIAEIYGDNISYPEYRDKLDKLIENYKANTGKTSLEEAESDRLRQEAWDGLIREKISQKEFDELGLRVSNEELTDMIIGNNIDQGLLQAPNFKNEQGIYDRAKVQEYINYIQTQATEQEKRMWETYKIQMRENRKFNKYFNLIGKSFYVPKPEAKQIALNQNKTVAFDFVFKNYTTIPDEDIKISEDDYKEYYEKNKYLYKQEASRGIEYVTFDVKPSEDDIKSIEEEINELKIGFEQAENGIEYANLNSNEPYEDLNYKPGQLEPQIDSLMFVADSGFVYGPYVVGNIYKLAKLVGTKMMPDSVEARHILIQPTSDKMTREEFNSLVDSVFNLIENGANFDDLAERFSADKKSAMVGGNIGWFTEGKMVPSFEEFCFKGKVGDIDKVNSQYGVHIIEILNQSEYNKRVNVAYVDKELYASNKTNEVIYAQAAKFAAEQSTKDVFEKYFEDNNDLTKKVADLKEDDKTVAGLEAARELIRWAFDAEENDFSSIFRFGDTYVYATLSDIREKGYADLEDVKEEMDAFIIKEKKADIIKKEISALNAKSVQDVASKLKLNVGTTSNVSFNSFSIDGAGFEPNVIAIATNMKKDELSKPIEGRAGVFIVKVTSVNEPQELEQMISAEKLKAKTGFQNQATYKVFEALKERADIKDYRSRYF